MIWYIIVGSILLFAILLIVSSIWEANKERHYTYNPKGGNRNDARNLDEYETNPSVIKQALKELYPEEWERNIKYYTERQSRDPEDNTLSEMKYHTLPCRLYFKSRIQLRDYWYETARSIGGYIIGGLSLIALISMIGPNVGCKVKWAVEEQAIKYEEEIVSLENNKQYIVTYYTSGVTKDIDISSTNIPAVIKEHNAQVKELLTKIKVDKINLSNPWVSPWVNPACMDVDLLRVEATYINTLA